MTQQEKELKLAKLLNKRHALRDAAYRTKDDLEMIRLFDESDAVAEEYKRLSAEVVE